MPLIYGAFSLKKEVGLEQFDILIQRYSSNNFKHVGLKFNFFSGGVFLNLSQPYQLNDCFFLYNNDVVVLFSGNIYNRDELHQLLDSEQKFKDPELISKLYINIGNDFVDKLNGDFSIIIYHKSKNQVFLYRDHLGVQPLAYSILEDCLYFSSDFMILSKALYKDEPINKKFLAQFIQNSGGIDYSITPDEKVKKVLPGHYLAFSAEQIREKKYWFPEKIKTDNALSFEIIVKDLKEILLDSVSIRSDKRFFAAAHLSGGLDSGIVAAIARKNYSGQSGFFGFSWASQQNSDSIDEEFDERIRLKDFQEQNNIQPVLCDINTDELLGYLSDWQYYSYLLDEKKTLEEAKKLGVNLIFSGWGGDEFISIDNAGFDYDLFFGFHFKTFFKRNPIKRPLTLGERFFKFIFLPAFKLDKIIKNPIVKWNKKYYYPPFNRKHFSNEWKLHYRSRREAHLSYLYNYHLAFRTETWAILGFQNNIEYRYPLLDKRIIEYMLKVPSKEIFNIDYYRYLIRELAKGIMPDSTRLNLSKYDGSRDYKEVNNLKQLSNNLFNSLEEMSRNKDLDFINFNALKHDAENFEHVFDEDDKIEFLYLLLAVMQMHEFTKGYKV